MSIAEVNIRVLDAAYVPFPAFKDWAARTSVDPVRWERYTASLEKLAKVSSREKLERARNIVKRAAAMDTGAIEGLYEVDRGFTFTVAFEAAMWETALAQKGEQVRSLFEAQLHAYDYVLDLATKAEPISEAAIRVLHEEVCRAQETYRVITAVGLQEQVLSKGQYKALPNHVRTRKGTDHSYAPVDVTPAEMARLVSELRSNDFLNAHPVLQAAYAHYGLVVIHPFADGNGRVARALASAFTYRAIRMPIVVLSEHRDAYLDALETADKGDYQSFVEFMLTRSLDTITLVKESVRSAVAPTAKESVEAIQRLYITRGGYTVEQVNQAGERLVGIVFAALQQELARNTNSRVFPTSGLVGGSSSLPPEYSHSRDGQRMVQVGLTSQQPAAAQVGRAYVLFVPRDAAGDDDFTLFFNQDDLFNARMDELTPAASGVLQVRAKMFAERVVNELLAELKDKAEQALRHAR